MARKKDRRGIPVSLWFMFFLGFGQAHALKVTTDGRGWTPMPDAWPRRVYPRPPVVHCSV
jgi:hypothetical protein